MLPEINETKHPFRNMILAPIWGLLFIMFLPAIGFGLFFVAIAKWVVGTINLPLATPATGSSYLTGSEPGDSPDRSLDTLQAEIDAKRGEQ
jgi:hypothetical protein